MPSPQTPVSPLALYLRPTSEMLCLATHSKLGLTSFCDLLRARQPHFVNGTAPPFAIHDGGVVALPVSYHLPRQSDPGRVLILHHVADPPHWLHEIGQAVLRHYRKTASLIPECLFHQAGQEVG